MPGHTPPVRMFRMAGKHPASIVGATCRHKRCSSPPPYGIHESAAGRTAPSHRTVPHAGRVPPARRVFPPSTRSVRIPHEHAACGNPLCQKNPQPVDLRVLNNLGFVHALPLLSTFRATARRHLKQARRTAVSVLRACFDFPCACFIASGKKTAALYSLKTEADSARSVRRSTGPRFPPGY